MVIHKKGRLHILVRLLLFLPKVKYHPILNKAILLQVILWLQVFNVPHQGIRSGRGGQNDHERPSLRSEICQYVKNENKRVPSRTHKNYILTAYNTNHTTLLLLLLLLELILFSERTRYFNTELNFSDITFVFRIISTTPVLTSNILHIILCMCTNYFFTKFRICCFNV